MSAASVPLLWSPYPRVHRVPYVPRRIPNEFYPTPPEAVRALLSVEQFDGQVWEPACGDGRIARVMAANGHDVVSTDLHDYGYGIAGVDFLRERRARGRHIVTNPPYGWGLADRFVRHALSLTRATGGKVAMLLNMASLCHPRRTAEWQQVPPARLYAVDDIVCWPEDRYGPPPHNFTKHRYVWAIWTSEPVPATRFGWLASAEFRKPCPALSFNLVTQRRAA